MTELDILRNHFLGFHNDFFDSFRRVSTYPPYNIKEKDDKGVIEFAVAGFNDNDLKVEVKENTLNVHGCKEDKDSDKFFHKASLIQNYELQKQDRYKKLLNYYELTTNSLKKLYFKVLFDRERDTERPFLF